MDGLGEGQIKNIEWEITQVSRLSDRQVEQWKKNAIKDRLSKGQVEWSIGWTMENIYKGQVEWRAGWAMEEYMKDRLS